MMQASALNHAVADTRRAGSIALAVLVLAFTALSIPFNLSLDLNPDVAWLLVIAGKTLHGSVLYRDIVAVNAPLASYSLVPVLLLSRLLHISLFQSVVATVTLLVIVSTGCATAALRRYEMPSTRLAIFAASMIVALLWLPGREFAEREHLFCILVLPYLIDVPLRNDLFGMHRSFSFAAAFAAGVAVNLKPPLAVIIASVELYALAVNGWRSLLSPAVAALAASTLLSVAAYLFLFPAYLTSVGPWMVALYSAYNDTSTTLREAALWGAFLVAMFLVWPREPDRKLAVLRLTLLVAGASALAAFAIQDKGWDYQTFITAFCGMLLLGGALPYAFARPLSGTVITAVALLLLTRATVQARGPDYVNYHFPAIKRLVQETPGNFLIMTTAGTPGGRDVVETGHGWASRFPCFEMLPGIVAAERRGQKSPWEAQFRTAVWQDMEKFQPALVFVQLDQLPGLPGNFDLLAWLLRDPAFAKQWSHYRRGSRTDLHFDLYRRDPDAYVTPARATGAAPQQPMAR